MNFHHGWVLMFSVSVLAAGCVTPPPPLPPVVAAPKPVSYVVLLDDADGTVGAISVSGPKGTVVVDRMAQGALLDGSGKAFAVEESRIRRDFGAALASRPLAPLSFLLYFETGGARLTAESQALLPKVLAAVKGYPVPDVSVIGHTDTEGDAEGNEKLGLQRAQAIAAQLAEAGLAVTVVTIESHGERNLLVKTPDNTAEAKNRRVEITIR